MNCTNRPDGNLDAATGLNTMTARIVKRTPDGLLIVGGFLIGTDLRTQLDALPHRSLAITVVLGDGASHMVAHPFADAALFEDDLQRESGGWRGWFQCLVPGIPPHAACMASCSLGPLLVRLPQLTP